MSHRLLSVRLVLAVFAAAATHTLTPNSVTASPTGVQNPTAWVIHGNDRSLAAVTLPNGPASLNVTSLGSFPNEMVVRGNTGYVVCSGSAAIHVIDLMTGTPLDTIPTGAGTNPYGIAVTSDTRAYVTLLATNQVAGIDLTAGMVTNLIPVGRSPEGITLSGGRLFVANTGFDFSTFGYDPGTVSVIDPTTDSVTHTLPVGLNPQNLDIAPDGTLHVCCTGNYFSVFGRAFVIDPAAPAVVDSLPVGGSPGFIAINASGHAYLSDYFLGLLKYDTATLTLLRDASNPIAVGIGAAGVDFDAAGNTYVCVYDDDQLVQLDTVDQISQAFPLGDGPQDVVIHTLEEPVPVRLAAFTAAQEAEGVRLSWTTSEQPDLLGFQVERSLDGRASWQTVSSRLIPAVATGSYTWLDAEIVAGTRRAATPGAPATETPSIVSYRLSSLDRSGRLEILPPLSIRLKAAPPLFVVTPNPVPRAAGTRIQFDNPVTGPVQVAIYDLSGRQVRLLLDAGLDAGAQSLFWDGRSDSGGPLSGGVYFVRVAPAANTAATRRLVLMP